MQYALRLNGRQAVFLWRRGLCSEKWRSQRGAYGSRGVHDATQGIRGRCALGSMNAGWLLLVAVIAVPTLFAGDALAITVLSVPADAMFTGTGLVAVRAEENLRTGGIHHTAD